MKRDIIICGVGGQGILSMAFVIDQAALEQELHVKQTEVHGMSQRGGAVVSYLRIADHPIHSDLIMQGNCDLILSVEPLESLRYVEYLAPEGMIITSNAPLINIPNYPAIDEITGVIRQQVNQAIIVDTKNLAEKAGSPKTHNMIMLGAASGYLQLESENLKKWIRNLFAPKGEKIVDMNLQAFEYGRAESVRLTNPS